MNGGSMSEQTHPIGSERYDWDEDPTAQDVIDAMRLAVLGQDDPAKAMGIVKELLEYAPDTMSNRGIDLLLRLVSEAKFKFEMKC
jgi:hypothetical protein